MRKISIPLFLVLLSGLNFATAQTQYTNIFKNLGPTYNQVSDDATLTNTPRIRSQDSFGACAGFSASCVLQYNFCRVNNINCENLSSDKEVSPFGALNAANTNKPGQLPGTIQNHNNIQFGGFGSEALRNMNKLSVVQSEACYPFDQVANKYGTDDAAVEKMLEKYRTVFNKAKTEGGVCESCLLSDIQRDLKSNISEIDIKRALNADTFGQFLYKVTVGVKSCNDILEFRGKYFAFPDKGTTATPEEAVAKMKEVLKQGHPMVLDGLCLYRENGKCVSNHSVAVTGYRKICSKTTGACREVVRLHNSWGQGWQDKFKLGPDDKVGGWVDALSLFEGKKIEAGDIAWLVPPPPKG